MVFSRVGPNQSIEWGQIRISKSDDPAAAQGTHEEKLAVFRRVRDEIAQKIDKELVPPPATQRARR